MAIYNIKNKGSGKYLNITGDYLTSLTNNQNVMQWGGSFTPEQTWVIDTIVTSSTGNGVPIKSHVDQNFSLNIYRTTKNADVYPIASNGGGDGHVYFEPVSGVANGYRIVTKSNFSTTKHYLSLASNSTANNINVCWAPYDGTNYQVWILEPMKYMNVNANLHYVSIASSEIGVRYTNAAKRTPTDSNYFNAGFFGDYGSVTGTLPAGNLIADFNESEISADNKDELVGRECTFSNGKVYKGCNNGGGNTNTSTFYIDSSNKAYIAQTSSVNSTWKYAISGAPIMVNGVAATSTAIQNQGWDLSWIYNTWHGCLAVATNSSTGADEFYYLAIKTTTSNFITTEVCNTLNDLGLGIQNAIMLDGGGSFIFKYDGTTRAETTENRKINNIMYF